MRTSGSRIAVWIVGCSLCAPISAQVTQRVSVGLGGVQGDHVSASPSISADGRYVAFLSQSTNLVSNDTNGTWDVFVRDRQSGVTELASVSSEELQADDSTDFPSISADGRFVVFESLASNLVQGDTNGTWDVFIRDRQSGTTEPVSLGMGGMQSNDASKCASVSADGRYVAFQSEASNLVPGDTNSELDIFVRDRQTGTTERVSVASAGTQANNDCVFASISADGRYVAFMSSATNLIAGDTNSSTDIFLRDRQLGTTELISVSSSGTQVNGYTSFPSVSSSARYVAFFSEGTNLVPGDTNGWPDIFVRDRQTNTTELVSVDSNGIQADHSSAGASISADGRYVAFQSDAGNLVPGDTNGSGDCFVRDLRRGTTERVSVDSSGVQGNSHSYPRSISADGRFVALHSLATNLVPGDTNLVGDAFVHDRNATGFAGLCDPGGDGVVSCPCSNAPSGVGRGCDNSAITGGAALSASGGSYLTMDSLVFATCDEKPTAMSIVMQGNGTIPGGLTYGQGVRCVGGTIICRLFTKSAVGGGITAPDFGAGDPTVSARSAAKGDVIQPGQSRWYLVYYRDPVVLGGCDAWKTFNATQTGRVDWSL